MKITLEALQDAINKSPLGYIKGDCRLVGLTPGEWGDWEDSGFFTRSTPEHRTIRFAYKDTLLGDLVVEEDYIESCSADEDSGLLDLHLDIRKDGTRWVIYIHCAPGFPGLHVFAEFVATVGIDPDIKSKDK